MSLQNEDPINTANPEINQDKATHSKGKGGNKSRTRRKDSRQSSTNKKDSKQIRESTSTRLGLNEPLQFGSLTPASSLRPGGVQINILGANECVTRMLTRLKTIAHRPLALLLTDANMLIYRKVCFYIITARIVAAQDGTGTHQQMQRFKGKTAT